MSGEDAGKVMAAPPMAAHGAAVLVVDDEEPIRRLLKHHLGSHHDFAASGTAEEALVLLAARRFQLVIADIGLPGRSGLELCESVTKLYPDTVVLMITGMAEAQYTRQAMAAGAFSFLAKPIDFARLVKVVEDALRHQAALVRRHHPSS